MTFDMDAINRAVIEALAREARGERLPAPRPRPVTWAAKAKALGITIGQARYRAEREDRIKRKLEWQRRNTDKVNAAARRYRARLKAKKAAA